MGIIGNNFRANFGVQTSIGDVIARSPGNAHRYSQFCNNRSQDGASTVLSGNAIPSGSYPSSSFYSPKEVGQMALRSFGEGTLSATLVPALQMTVTLDGVGELTASISGRQEIGVAFTGSGDLNATAIGIGDLTAALTGSGGLAGAMTGLVDMGIGMDGSGGLSGEALLVIAMLCDMAGSGGLSASVLGSIEMALAAAGSGTLAADINGRYDTAVAMAGSGGLVGSMSAFGNMVAALQGSGDLDATIAAFGDMSIDIVVTGTGLTTSNVGQAVWDALATVNNNTGTMGEKLNLAGSGGVDYDALKDAIWQAEIEGTWSAEELLRLFASVLVGKVSGANTSVETFRDIDDTKNRVTASVDASGNRTGIVLDATD